MAGTRSRSSGLFSGLVLISVGALLLLHNYGSLDLSEFFTRWWPLLIIFWGVVKLFERTVGRRFGGGGITGSEVWLVLGLLALMGVSVQTAVILLSYINKLRNEGHSIQDATLEASLLRLRPIMMTALVACLGLLPAAMATGVGSDTQKPFAIVVVAGLISRLLLGFFVNPVLYLTVAREGDVLQV